MNNLEKRQQGFPSEPEVPGTRERYIEHPYFCPFCEHRAIEATKLDAFENLVFQQVRCDGCEKEWVDTYELIDYEEM
jgi:transcription elongation factor Elf1